MKKKTLLIVTNVDWFLISHRLVIAKAARTDGWRVFVACEDTGRSNDIAVDGIEYINFPLSRSGTNPIEEYRLYKRFIKLYKEIKPDVVHQITIKPVVYGSLAAKRVGIKGVVNAISGMGYMFSEGKLGIMQQLILNLMRRGSNLPNVSYIFQNKDDREILKQFGVIDKCKSISLIKGSGIDLNSYKFTPLIQSDLIKILLPCRMLWDKGVKELREASDMLKKKYRDRIQFVLVGMAEDENKSAVSAEYLNEWQDGNYVIWKGHVSDMISEYQEAHLVVLPSYREGLPKTLIEACAIGRPIVTTNAVGCKDCVDNGINGYKVNVGDSSALAIAIEKLVNDYSLMVEMGVNGRKKAEEEFDVKDVITRHLNIYQSYL